MSAADTIVALSSGALPSGVAVIRLSGPAAFAAVRALAGRLEADRHLGLRALRDPATGEAIDHGLVAGFGAPHSFTGEDCAEIHCHGSRAVVSKLLEILGTWPGCRLATAGEFTRRAFENGRLDLTQVEGLGDLIAADTEAQRRLAVRRMEGALGRTLAGWRKQLIGLSAEVEARLDFAEEGDVDGELPERFGLAIDALAAEIEAQLQGFEGGRLIRDGVRVTLAGAPNAGKSTLLNALARSDVAIVTEVPGTTRDVLEVPLNIGGYLFVVSDTAGLRETVDPVESEGVRRARARIEASDLVLELVAPDAEVISLQVPENIEVWRLATKSDLAPAGPAKLAISALRGDGLEDLQGALLGFAQARAGGGEPGLVGHARDRQHLGQAAAALRRAGSVEALELKAEELRRAGDEVGRLSGEIDAEAVLDRLFEGFCIGK